MEARVRQFREGVRRQGLGRVGRRYPAPLRALAVEVARDRSSEPLSVVAGELGVAVGSLERWLAGAPGVETARPAEFYPVQVGAQVDAELSGWVVVAPSGMRVEGRDTAALLAVLRELS